LFFLSCHRSTSGFYVFLIRACFLPAPYNIKQLFTLLRLITEKAAGGKRGFSKGGEKTDMVEMR